MMVAYFVFVQVSDEDTLWPPIGIGVVLLILTPLDR